MRKVMIKMTCTVPESGLSEIVERVKKIAADSGYEVTAITTAPQLVEDFGGDAPRVDPVFLDKDTGKWRFFDEVWCQTFGPFDTKEQATEALYAYIRGFDAAEGSFDLPGNYPDCSWE